MQIQIVSCFGTSCVEVNNSMYGIKVDLYVFFLFSFLFFCCFFLLLLFL